MPAINIVFEGEKIWIFISESDFQRLPRDLQLSILSESFFLSKEYLEAHNIPYKEVRVKAGEGLFVPSGVLHSVQNEDGTIAVAFNLMLPTTLSVAWETFGGNRALSSLLQRNQSKVCLQQLVVRVASHLSGDTHVAKELRQVLSSTAFSDLKLVVKRLIMELKDQESVSFEQEEEELIVDEKHRTVTFNRDSSSIMLIDSAV